MRPAYVAAVLAGVWMSVTGCTMSDPLLEMAQVPIGPFAMSDTPGGSVPYIQARRVDDGPLSLPECIEFALQHNPETSVSWHGIRASAAALGQQRSRYWPQVEFTANGQRRKYQDLTEPVDEILQTTYEASFGVTQLLLDGGVRRANVSAAEAALRSTALRHNMVLLDVALEVESAYYNFLAAESLLEVAQSTVVQRNKQLELAQKLQRAGLARQVDVLQTMAERDDAQLAFVGARNQVRIARGRLASVMGLVVSAPLAIVDVPEEVRVLQQRDVDELLELAVQARPVLRAAVEQISGIRQQVRAERAARRPSLEAQASYGWRDTDLLPTDKEEWTVAVLLSVPIFTGFQRTYRIRQAEAELADAIAGYERLLRDVELGVWEAYSNVIQAEEAIGAARTFVQSAQGSLHAIERAYESGKATIVELVDAQTVVTRALSREVTARLGWYLAVATLERAVGEGWSGMGAPSAMELMLLPEAGVLLPPEEQAVPETETPAPTPTGSEEPPPE